ncbi:MAG: hypothetical protein JSW61_13905 [Candidatus Thorarchaeota archaeon]|nr:MAG: hypothetical protein JSW61_13905 [Candidatus Thorarchaeota archaeon]
MARAKSVNKQRVYGALAKLGLKMEDEQESRSISLLRTILRLQQNARKPLMFSEIYGDFTREGAGEGLTKAWVHRVLKKLVDAGFVRVESPTAHRKRYTSDVNSIMNALEKLRSERIEGISNLMKDLEDDLSEVEKIDPGALAQELFRQVAGREQPIGSRSIKGLDEWHRVTDSTIFQKAEPGDIIRTSVMNIGPFLQGVEKRIGRVIAAGSRGVDIRYMIPPAIFRQDDEIRERVQREWLVNALGQFAELVNKGMRFDARLNVGMGRSFAFISLNDECIALMISENPIMGAWMTRDFNPHLIDNALAAFDETWEKSRSIIGLTPSDLAKIGASSESYLHSMIEKGQERAKKRQGEDEGEK